MIRLRRLRWLVVAALLPLGLAAAQDPAAELTRAVEGLGLPGLLWGRLAVEEESPEGPWTPLAGVSVALFPYAPSVAAELERIRDAARGSSAAHDAAVGRLLDRLKAYEVQAASLAGPERPLVRRVTTDPAGLFVFDDVPSGEWLVVAVQTAPYAPGRASRPPEAIGSRRSSRNPDTFLPRPGTPAKEAEVWVSRVRVTAGERARILLTDRARFMVGPVR
jgi:hypothetical protein